MQKLHHGGALVGVAALSALSTIGLISLTTSPTHPAPTVTKHVTAGRRHATQLAAVRARVRTKAKPKRHARPKPHTVRVAAHHIGASPSLYERTTSIRVLRAQGCAAGKKQTSGLVVLDFGKLDFRSRRAGYGTITFADTFAPNRAITWAMKSYARGYSECLSKHATAHITLARGTSNYGQEAVPSTYTAGRLWAGATVALANYLKRHHFDHVTAAAADDVEPAWDRSFTHTYDFFRGYAKSDHGYLLYNYGSLDGGVGGIWKLRQAFYVSGGMRYARAVPEIYNRAMAQEWADLARQSFARYGRPIQLAGLMTQHWTSCHRCGYTAPKAKQTLVHELSKVKHGLPPRTLASVTNIAAAPPIDISG